MVRVMVCCQIACTFRSHTGRRPAVVMCFHHDFSGQAWRLRIGSSNAVDWNTALRVENINFRGRSPSPWVAQGQADSHPFSTGATCRKFCDPRLAELVVATARVS